LAKWESRASALELTGLARLEMQDIFWWKHFTKILIRQDCYRQFGNQENGTRND
jgi:hypothetical protein